MPAVASRRRRRLISLGDFGMRLGDPLEARIELFGQPDLSRRTERSVPGRRQSPSRAAAAVRAPVRPSNTEAPSPVSRAIDDEEAAEREQRSGVMIVRFEPQ